MNWIRKNFNEITVSATIVSFVAAGILLVFNFSQNETKIYHEIAIDNTALTKRIVTIRLNRFDSLRRATADRIKMMESKGDTLKEKKVVYQKLKVLLTGANKAYIQSRIELNKLKYHNTDTLPSSSLAYFSVDRNKLETFLRDTVKTNSIMVEVVDTSCLFEEPVTISDTLKIAPQPSETIDFLARNPSFGFWFFLTMAQMAMWVLFIFLIGGALFRLSSRVNLVNVETLFRGSLPQFIIAVLLIGLFAGGLYLIIIDSYIIKDNYFLSDFNTRMIIYSISGYVVAAFCFGVYLFLSRVQDHLDQAATSAGIAIGTSTTLQEESKAVTKTFEQVFILTAIILSVFVIWLGSLFQSINGMEAMQYYKLLSGKHFLNYDMVYLIGLVHSVLLLTFYIPVKLKFNSLSITQAQTAASQATKTNTQKTMGAIAEVFFSLIVTTAPLLSGFLQAFIKNIFSE